MERYLTPDDLPRTGWQPPVHWFVSRVQWREVGRKVSQHPEVLQQSREYLVSILESGDYSCSPRYLHQWDDLLRRGMQPVIDVLTSPDDDKSQVLRSCTPLPIRLLLSQEEREQVRRQVSQELNEMGLGR